VLHVITIYRPPSSNILDFHGQVLQKRAEIDLEWVGSIVISSFEPLGIIKYSRPTGRALFIWFMLEYA
jgi:hypothetical protein